MICWSWNLHPGVRFKAAIWWLVLVRSHLSRKWAADHMGSHCFLANEYLTRQTNLAGKRVMVIGGGQTGAEITLDLLTSSNAPAQVSWVGMLPRFSPLEEGGFVDQVFTPQYVASFQNWPEENRQAETRSQKLASDGLTPVTVDALYREVYHRKHLQAAEESVQLLPGREVFGHFIRSGWLCDCQPVQSERRGRGL